MWEASEVKKKKFKKKKKRRKGKKGKKASLENNNITINSDKFNFMEIDIRDLKIKMLDEHMDDWINKAMKRTKKLDHSSLIKFPFFRYFSNLILG